MYHQQFNSTFLVCCKYFYVSPTIHVNLSHSLQVFLCITNNSCQPFSFVASISMYHQQFMSTFLIRCKYFYVSPTIHVHLSHSFQIFLCITNNSCQTFSFVSNISMYHQQFMSTFLIRCKYFYVSPTIHVHLSHLFQIFLCITNNSCQTFSFVSNISMYHQQFMSNFLICFKYFYVSPTIHVHLSHLFQIFLCITNNSCQTFSFVSNISMYHQQFMSTFLICFKYFYVSPTIHVHLSHLFQIFLCITNNSCPPFSFVSNISMYHQQFMSNFLICFKYFYVSPTIHVKLSHLFQIFLCITNNSCQTFSFVSNISMYHQQFMSNFLICFKYFYVSPTIHVKLSHLFQIFLCITNNSCPPFSFVSNISMYHQQFMSTFLICFKYFYVSPTIHVKLSHLFQIFLCITNNSCPPFSFVSNISMYHQQFMSTFLICFKYFYVSPTIHVKLSHLFQIFLCITNNSCPPFSFVSNISMYHQQFMSTFLICFKYFYVSPTIHVHLSHLFQIFLCITNNSCQTFSFVSNISMYHQQFMSTFLICFKYFYVSPTIHVKLSHLFQIFLCITNNSCQTFSFVSNISMYHQQFMSNFLICFKYFYVSPTIHVKLSHLFQIFLCITNNSCPPFSFVSNISMYHQQFMSNFLICFKYFYVSPTIHVHLSHLFQIFLCITNNSCQTFSFVSNISMYHQQFMSNFLICFKYFYVSPTIHVKLSHLFQIFLCITNNSCQTFSFVSNISMYHQQFMSTFLICFKYFYVSPTIHVKLSHLFQIFLCITNNSCQTFSFVSNISMYHQQFMSNFLICFKYFYVSPTIHVKLSHLFQIFLCITNNSCQTFSFVSNISMYHQQFMSTFLICFKYFYVSPTIHVKLSHLFQIFLCITNNSCPPFSFVSNISMYHQQFMSNFLICFKYFYVSPTIHVHLSHLFQIFLCITNNSCPPFSFVSNISMYHQQFMSTFLICFKYFYVSPTIHVHLSHLFQIFLCITNNSCPPFSFVSNISMYHQQFMSTFLICFKYFYVSPTIHVHLSHLFQIFLCITNNSCPPFSFVSNISMYHQQFMSTFLICFKYFYVSPTIHVHLSHLFQIFLCITNNSCQTFSFVSNISMYHQQFMSNFLICFKYFYVSPTIHVHLSHLFQIFLCITNNSCQTFSFVSNISMYHQQFMSNFLICFKYFYVSPTIHVHLSHLFQIFLCITNNSCPPFSFVSNISMYHQQFMSTFLICFKYFYVSPTIHVKLSHLFQIFLCITNNSCQTFSFVSNISMYHQQFMSTFLICFKYFYVSPTIHVHLSHLFQIFLCITNNSCPPFSFVSNISMYHQQFMSTFLICFKYFYVSPTIHVHLSHLFQIFLCITNNSCPPFSFVSNISMYHQQFMSTFLICFKYFYVSPTIHVKLSHLFQIFLCITNNSCQTFSFVSNISMYHQQFMSNFLICFKYFYVSPTIHVHLSHSFQIFLCITNNSCQTFSFVSNISMYHQQFMSTFLICFKYFYVSPTIHVKLSHLFQIFLCITNNSCQTFSFVSNISMYHQQFMSNFLICFKYFYVSPTIHVKLSHLFQIFLCITNNSCPPFSFVSNISMYHQQFMSNFLICFKYFYVSPTIHVHLSHSFQIFLCITNNSCQTFSFVSNISMYHQQFMSTFLICFKYFYVSPTIHVHLSHLFQIFLCITNNSCQTFSFVSNISMYHQQFMSTFLICFKYFYVSPTIHVNLSHSLQVFLCITNNSCPPFSFVSNISMYHQQFMSNFLICFKYFYVSPTIHVNLSHSLQVFLCITNNSCQPFSFVLNISMYHQQFNSTFLVCCKYFYVSPTIHVNLSHLFQIFLCITNNSCQPFSFVASISMYHQQFMSTFLIRCKYFYVSPTIHVKLSHSFQIFLCVTNNSCQPFSFVASISMYHQQFMSNFLIRFKYFYVSPTIHVHLSHSLQVFLCITNNSCQPFSFVSNISMYHQQFMSTFLICFKYFYVSPTIHVKLSHLFQIFLCITNNSCQTFSFVSNISMYHQQFMSTFLIRFKYFYVSPTIHVKLSHLFQIFLCITNNSCPPFSFVSSISMYHQQFMSNFLIRFKYFYVSPTIHVNLSHLFQIFLCITNNSCQTFSFVSNISMYHQQFMSNFLIRFKYFYVSPTIHVNLSHLFQIFLCITNNSCQTFSFVSNISMYHQQFMSTFLIRFKYFYVSPTIHVKLSHLFQIFLCITNNSCPPFSFVSNISMYHQQFMSTFLIRFKYFYVSPTIHVKLSHLFQIFLCITNNSCPPFSFVSNISMYHQQFMSTFLIRCKYFYVSPTIHVHLSHSFQIFLCITNNSCQTFSFVSNISMYHQQFMSTFLIRFKYFYVSPTIQLNLSRLLQVFLCITNNSCQPFSFVSNISMYHQQFMSTFLIRCKYFYVSPTIHVNLSHSLQVFLCITNNSCQTFSFVSNISMCHQQFMSTFLIRCKYFYVSPTIHVKLSHSFQIFLCITNNSCPPFSFVASISMYHQQFMSTFLIRFKYFYVSPTIQLNLSRLLQVFLCITNNSCQPFSFVASISMYHQQFMSTFLIRFKYFYVSPTIHVHPSHLFQIFLCITNNSCQPFSFVASISMYRQQFMSTFLIRFKYFYVSPTIHVHLSHLFQIFLCITNNSCQPFSFVASISMYHQQFMSTFLIRFKYFYVSPTIHVKLSHLFQIFLCITNSSCQPFSFVASISMYHQQFMSTFLIRCKYFYVSPTIHVNLSHLFQIFLCITNNSCQPFSFVASISMYRQQFMSTFLIRFKYFYVSPTIHVHLSHLFQIFLCITNNSCQPFSFVASISMYHQQFMSTFLIRFKYFYVSPTIHVKLSHLFQIFLCITNSSCQPFSFVASISMYHQQFMSTFLIRCKYFYVSPTIHVNLSHSFQIFLCITNNSCQPFSFVSSTAMYHKRFN